MLIRAGWISSLLHKTWEPPLLRVVVAERARYEQKKKINIIRTEKRKHRVCTHVHDTIHHYNNTDDSTIRAVDSRTRGRQRFFGFRFGSRGTSVCDVNARRSRARVSPGAGPIVNIIIVPLLIRTVDRRSCLNRRRRRWRSPTRRSRPRGRSHRRISPDDPSTRVNRI